MNDFLQLLNIVLTSGVFMLLVGAAVAYGRLVQKVETHDGQIKEIWERHNKLNDVVLMEGRKP